MVHSLIWSSLSKCIPFLTLGWPFQPSKRTARLFRCCLASSKYVDARSTRPKVFWTAHGLVFVEFMIMIYDHTYFVHRSYVGCLHVEQTHIKFWECLQRRDPETLFFSFLKIKFRDPLFGDIPTCLGGEVEDCGIQPSQCVYASDLLQVAVSLQWVKKSNVRLFRSGAWHTVLNHKACQPDSDPAESHDGCLRQARNFAEGMRRKPNCQAFWIWWCIAIQLLEYNFRLNQFVDRDPLPTIPWNNFRLNQFLDPLHTIPFHIWIWYIGAPCMGGLRHNRQFYSFAPVAQRLTLPWTIWWCVPGWGIALFCWIL